MNQRRRPYRNRAILQSARGQSCVRCGKNDGTIVAAHYTGIRQHAYGKGGRIKCSDLATAHLCHLCHSYFDNPTQRKSIEASEEFLHLIMLTTIRRHEDER